MSSLPQIFAKGISMALRRWRLLLPLYLAGLLLGLAQAWPLIAAGGALYSPVLGGLARGDVSPLDLALADPRAAGATAGGWVLAALLLGGLFSLAYNFFSGGILASYVSDADDTRAAGRPFWPACRRWFWSFAGLGLLLVVLAVLALVVAGVLGAVLGARAAAITAPLLLALINTLGEYARAIAVARDRRNPFALLGMAAGFFGRHAPGVLALALLGLLLHAALAAAYATVARSLGGSAALVLWQQIAVLSWLWIKLLRLAWAAGYVRSGESDRAGMATSDAAAPAV